MNDDTGDLHPAKGFGRVWSWIIMVGWLLFGVISIWFGRDINPYRFSIGAWVLITVVLFYWQGRVEGKASRRRTKTVYSEKLNPEVVVMKKAAEIPPQDSSDSDS